MVKSREESERDPARSVVLRLQSYSCFIAVWCREKNEREERKHLGGVEKERERGGDGDGDGWGTRDRKSRQPWFAVTPPQASCAIFNTQAHVLSNLSCPAFNIKRRSVTASLH